MRLPPGWHSAQLPGTQKYISRWRLKAYWLAAREWCRNVREEWR